MVNGAAAADEVRWVLIAPPDAEGVVVIPGPSFFDDRWSAPRQPRAYHLNRIGLAVLRVDLLSPELAGGPHRRDVPRLADRLVEAVHSMVMASPGDQLPIGLLGTGNTAAVVLWAAADLGAMASSVVCWSGRPELAGPRLADVTGATLFVVGDGDGEVFERNVEAQGGLRCRTHLRVVPGATESFAEPGTLAAVEAATVDWFTRHMTGSVGPLASEQLAGGRRSA